MNQQLKLLAAATVLTGAVHGQTIAPVVSPPGTVSASGPNNVYIEQIGNSNLLTIEQVGIANNIGGVSSTTPGSTNYATINGSFNTVAVTQTGNSNLGQYSITGSNNAYTNTTVGSGNSSKLVMGDTNTANLRNTVIETITGDNNITDQNLVGNDIKSTLAITGNANKVTTVLKSTNGVSDIAITGNTNQIDAEQVDIAGAFGHSLKQVIVGDTNSVVTQQQGTNDTMIDIRNTGSNNTITVRTSSVAIINPMVAGAR